MDVNINGVSHRTMDPRFSGVVMTSVVGLLYGCDQEAMWYEGENTKERIQIQTDYGNHNHRISQPPLP